jgi:hypothetical protein
MLRELNVVEQRYQAVLEVLDGIPVTEIAERFGAGPPPLPAASGDVIEVERTVNASGDVSLGDCILSAGLPLAGQKIQVGLVHARKTVAVTVGPDTYQVAVEPGITITAPRTAGRDVRRHKASSYG